MTSTLRFNLSDVRLCAAERREFQTLSRKLIELKCARLTGEGRVKSLRALGQDRCGSCLPINRYFFCFFAALSPPNKQQRCYMLDQSRSMSSSWSLGAGLMDTASVCPKRG
jgi:hypothetical protein